MGQDWCVDRYLEFTRSDSRLEEGRQALCSANPNAFSQLLSTAAKQSKDLSAEHLRRIISCALELGVSGDDPSLECIRTLHERLEGDSKWDELKLKLPLVCKLLCFLRDELDD